MYLLNLFDCGSLVKDPQSNKYMEIIYISTINSKYANIKP